MDGTFIVAVMRRRGYGVHGHTGVRMSVVRLALDADTTTGPRPRSGSLRLPIGRGRARLRPCGEQRQPA
jgi:hypothetical protein